MVHRVQFTLYIVPILKYILVLFPLACLLDHMKLQTYLFHFWLSISPTISLRHLASALWRIDPMYISVSVCFLLLLLQASSGLSRQYIFIIISIIDLPIGWSYSHQNLSSSIFPISFFFGLNSSILLSSSFPSYASLSSLFIYF